MRSGSASTSEPRAVARPAALAQVCVQLASACRCRGSGGRVVQVLRGGVAAGHHARAAEEAAVLHRGERMQPPECLAVSTCHTMLTLDHAQVGARRAEHV